MPSDLQRVLWPACYTVFDRASRTREQRLAICAHYAFFVPVLFTRVWGW